MGDIAAACACMQSCHHAAEAPAVVISRLVIVTIPLMVFCHMKHTAWFMHIVVSVDSIFFNLSIIIIQYIDHHHNNDHNNHHHHQQQQQQQHHVWMLSSCWQFDSNAY
jgi:hypothetical protein